MKAFWYLGVALQVVGIAAVPIALLVGIGGGNLGKEYLIAIPAIAVFFFGTWMRRASGGG